MEWSSETLVHYNENSKWKSDNLAFGSSVINMSVSCAEYWAIQEKLE